MKRLFTFCLAIVMLLSTTILLCPAAQAEATATVKGGWLKLRAGASTNSAVMGTYFTGTQVTVLQTQGDWYQVITPDGKTGYMMARYLNLYPDAGSGDSLPGMQEIAAWVTSDNGNPVNLRSGPDTSYSVLGSFAVDTPATIIASGSSWYQIRIGGQTGYMLSTYLTTKQPGNAPAPESPTQPAGSYIARVTSTNGKPVNMRAGAGTQYQRINTCTVGTQVTVLKEQGAWAYLDVNGTRGWMMLQFLIRVTPTPTAIASVSLSTSAPAVGDVLSATVTPAEAEVTYAWLDSSGNLLSTEAQYPVTVADVGRQIQVRVTGTGEYTGTVTSDWTAVIAAPDTKIPLTGLTINVTGAPVVGQKLTAVTTPSNATVTYYWWRWDGRPSTWWEWFSRTLSNTDSYTVTTEDVGLRIYVQAVGAGLTEGLKTAYTDIVIPATHDK